MPYKVQLAYLALIFSLIAGLGSAKGCGVELDLPKNHFDGVNEWGELSYWEQIGELDLGEDAKLPLIINFRSGRESSSQYLGKGWIFAPLDSNMVQVSENQFLMLQPNGTMTNFTRARSTDKILYGQGVWMAEIKGDTITAWSNCGGKLIFEKGRLTTIELKKGKKVNLTYTGNKVDEIRVGGRTLARVEIDPTSGETVGIVYGGKKIAIEKGKKPFVQMIAGQKVIGATDQSLSKLTLSDGTILDYAFGVDKEMNPTFRKLVGTYSRLMSWDTRTRHIIKDEDWIYDIKPSSSHSENAAIGRINNDGTRQFWFLNKLTGEEILEEGDGFKIIRQSFVSGSLRGKMRQIERQSIGGNHTEIIVYTYDEKGNIVRDKRSIVAKDGITHQSVYLRPSDELMNTGDGNVQQMDETAVSPTENGTIRYVYDKKLGRLVVTFVARNN